MYLFVLTRVCAVHAHVGVTMNVWLSRIGLALWKAKTWRTKVLVCPLLVICATWCFTFRDVASMYKETKSLEKKRPDFYKSMVLFAAIRSKEPKASKEIRGLPLKF